MARCKVCDQELNLQNGTSSTGDLCFACLGHFEELELLRGKVRAIRKKIALRAHGAGAVVPEDDVSRILNNVDLGLTKVDAAVGEEHAELESVCIGDSELKFAFSTKTCPVCEKRLSNTTVCRRHVLVRHLGYRYVSLKRNFFGYRTRRI
jgi:hypothetical protein